MFNAYDFPSSSISSRVDKFQSFIEDYLYIPKLGMRSVVVINSTTCILQEYNFRISKPYLPTTIKIITYLTIVPLITALTIKAVLRVFVNPRKMIDPFKEVVAGNVISPEDLQCIKNAIPDLLTGKQNPSFELADIQRNFHQFDSNELSRNVFRLKKPYGFHGLDSRYQRSYRLFDSKDKADAYTKELCSIAASIAFLNLKYVKSQKINVYPIDHADKTYILVEHDKWEQYETKQDDYITNAIDQQETELHEPLDELLRLLERNPVRFLANDSGISISAYTHNGNPRWITLRDAVSLENALKRVAAVTNKSFLSTPVFCSFQESLFGYNDKFGIHQPGLADLMQNHLYCHKKILEKKSSS